MPGVRKHRNCCRCADTFSAARPCRTGVDSGRPLLPIVGEMCHSPDVRFMQDNNVPIIMTDHAATENPGMRSLTKLVEKEFSMPTHFIETGCPLRTVV